MVAQLAMIHVCSEVQFDDHGVSGVSGVFRAYDARNRSRALGARHMVRAFVPHRLLNRTNAPALLVPAIHRFRRNGRFGSQLHSKDTASVKLKNPRPPGGSQGDQD